MGVHGLWRLIDASGKPVPLETLENKVLAVDVSIWLHQAIKGFQDSKGAPLPNAHLLGIYHRVCKLLYFKIKPVFVFDGGVPVLKKETIAKRNQLKARNMNDANKIQKQILNTLLKHTAVNKVLSEQTKSQLPVKPQKQHDQQNQDDLFKLPPSQLDSTFSSSDDEEYTSTSDSSPTKYWDIHTIDEKSAEFRSLPADVRHEILTDLKETRKQSSWGRIHELPTESNEFSGYQMKRLLKRFSIQSSLEETEKEMGGHSLSLKELESLLNDHGVVTDDSVGNRIASDENTRYLYIKDVKKALEKARVESLNPIIEEEKEISIKDGSNQNKEGETSLQENLKKNEGKETPDLSSVSSKGDLKHSNETFDDKAGTSREDSEIINDLEYQRDLNLAIQLSLQEVPSSSNVNVDGQSKPKSKKTSCSVPKIKNLEVFSAAMGYMMDYGGLTPAGVNEILMGKKVKEDESESDEEKSIISKLLEEEFYSSKNSNSRDSNQGNKNSELVEADVKLLEVDVKLVERDIKLVEKDENLVKTDEHKKSDVIEVDRNFSNTKESERKDLRGVVSIQDSVNTIEGNNQEINIQKNLTKNIITAKTIESNSSESAVKRGEIKLVTENDSVDSNSSDDDFVEVPVDTKNESSDEDDFIEISEKSKLKNNNERTVSGSESEDDFMEVSEKEKILEVVIDKNKMEDDEDIFSDIFSADKEEKIDLTKLLLEKNKKTLKEQLINQVENKQDDQIKSESLERKNFLEQKLQNPNKVESVDLSKLMVKSDKKSVHFSLETNDNDLKIIGEDVKKIKDDIKEKHKSEVKEVVATKINEDQEVEVRKTTVSLSTDELKQMEEYFEREKESLIVERSNKERLANNITDQMYQEAQELLQLFGVPYIVAPMEAEAQCAFLNEANLTDGTITDDSDIWLFGGKTVYRNFFNQSKRVMEFNSENIEHHFNLSRLKLIQLSLLVGSDYTVGLQGVGPVTALEILAAFPSYNENAALTYQQVISGLIRFRNWFKQGRIAGPGKAALRTKLRNLEVTESFPNPNVAKAYLEPEIETSREKFSWGKPDIVALTDYAKQKFGWSQKKSEEILKPVVKRLQENRMQSTIKDYFKTKHKINVTDLSEKMSKRVKSAVNRMGNIGDDDDGEEVEEKVSKGGKGRKKRGTDEDNVKKPRGNKKALNDTENEENPGSSKNTSEDANIEAVGIKKTRSRKKASKNDDNDDTGKKTMSRKKALNAIDSKEYPISSNKISTEDKPLRSKKVLKAIEVEDKETSIKKASNDVEIEENPNSSKNITGIENSTSSKNIADVVEAECIKKTRSRKKTLKNDANEDQAMKKPRSENNLEESEGNTKSRTRNKSLREEYLEDDNKVVSAQNLDLNEHSESSEINDESTLINKLAVMERLKACCKNTPGLSKYTIKAKELKKAKQKKNSSKSDTNNSTDFSMEIDEDLLELHNVEIASVKKVKEIEDSMKEQFEKNLKRTLHAKEVIHQKERDRSEMVRSKMRAIEAFRKSKNGPGFVKKRPKFVRKPKDDAELSEDSSDD